MASKVKIVAECEINHNGELALAKRMVDAALASGADSVKFQCFVTESSIAPGSSFLPVFKEREFGLEDFRELRDYAQSKGIEMISTAADRDGLQMIVELDLPIIKIGSTNITNLSLLRAAAETKKPIYLSSGASTLGEVEAAFNILSKGTNNITLFHCTVQYPAPEHLLNLRAITTMAAAFPGIPIGYSDHTIGSTAAIAAVTLGAAVLEKHFTLDNKLPGPDHFFSTNPEDFAAYVRAVRATEIMLGSANKGPVKEEEAIRLSGRRYLTAMVDIPEGAEIVPEMIRPRRVDVAKTDWASVLGPDFEDTVVGWCARRPIPRGSAITWGDLEANPRKNTG